MTITVYSWNEESDDIFSDLVDIVEDVKSKKGFIKYNKKACISIIQKCERLMLPLQNFKSTVMSTSQSVRSTLITECSVESVDSLDIDMVTNNDDSFKCLNRIKEVFVNCQTFITKYGLSEGYFNLEQDLDADEEYRRLRVRLTNSIKELNLELNESDKDSYDDESNADTQDNIISLDPVPLSKPTAPYPRSKC